MRWIVRGLSALVGLVALALVALWLVPAETVARLAAAEFQRMTGRALAIEGPVKATIWPALGVRTGPVSIANAGWSGQGPMLAARSLEVRLDLGAAVSGRLAVEAASFDGLRLVLERRADGQVNWALPTGEAPAAAPAGQAQASTGLPLTLTQGRLTDAEILWIDHAAGSRLALRGVNAELRLPETSGPLSLTAEGMLDDTPVRLALEAADAATLAAGHVARVKLDVAAGGSTLAFEGRAGASPASAEGSLRADLADLRALADLAGSAPPELPEGLGRRIRQLAGQITLAPEGTLHLRQGELVLDANRLSVAGDMSFDGPRPRVVAQLEGGALSVPGLSPRPTVEETEPAAAPADAGWSRTPLDASALALADAEVALRATSVDLGAAQLGATRLMLTIDRARAVIEARELRAWDGLITGQFVVNNRSGLSVGGDLSLAGLATGPMLSQLAGWDRLLSQGDLQLKFLGVGQSMAAIMASLSGEGRFALGKGELRGLDLVGMLRTLDTGFVGEGQKTIFDGLSASFRIANGDLATEDLRLAAPYLTATGRGTLGFGAQVMDLRITPVALANPDGSGGLRVPLEITGPWSDPRFRLDLKALADQELAEEKARLEAAAREAEARAKAEAERRAAEELGIERREGESFEDAAKRRAQEALDAEAGRVLDRLLRRAP